MGLQPQDPKGSLPPLGLSQDSSEERGAGVEDAEWRHWDREAVATWPGEHREEEEGIGMRSTSACGALSSA